MITEQGTQANYRHCRAVKDDLERFVAWVKQRDDFSPAEKDRLVSLWAEFSRGTTRQR